MLKAKVKRKKLCIKGKQYVYGRIDNLPLDLVGQEVYIIPAEEFDPNYLTQTVGLGQKSLESFINELRRYGYYVIKKDTFLELVSSTVNWSKKRKELKAFLRSQRNKP